MSQNSNNEIISYAFNYTKPEIFQQVGYSLVDSSNKEVEFWGSSTSLSPKPQLVIMPNGLQVHDPKLNFDYNGYRVVPRFVEETQPPSRWHVVDSETINYDAINQRIIVTYKYSDNPIITPQTVTPLQIRKALRSSNLNATVENYVSTLSDEEKEVWEYATEIDRNNPLIAKAAEALNFSNEQIDDIFRLAATL